MSWIYFIIFGIESITNLLKLISEKLPSSNFYYIVGDYFLIQLVGDCGLFRDYTSFRDYTQSPLYTFSLEMNK